MVIIVENEVETVLVVVGVKTVVVVVILAAELFVMVEGMSVDGSIDSGG